ncbi:MAG: 23S rRNA (pseudouridine(1915)-N(3))-methyltransferase RlmH [Bauldia sp.]|uniref:23S rRNA (pseudouridine(1915)-N(3))-methyltransferase RlmH n=1 Tax=Bauldia sp. TaxID=2575872 RepID=UPI001D344D2F|nr:23S rRNA (pseudouridine(1915)-N(3))-methyltransferase RlmH [Bauldia sp.]MCB1496222.1 23S rRNA (pseudouridine(1915)-N(3))-methyltransferase RlmH [Bauldia sp.]
MKVVVAAIGRLKAGPERVLLDRYVDRAARAGRQLGLTFDLRELPESSARQASERKQAEGESLAALLPPGALLVVLDEGGRSLDSRSFAGKIAEWRDSGARDLVFAIGGPDGLAPDLIARADLRLAFGAVTWPHQLVRIMLAEQLYRTVTILSGHPYHRD